MLSSPFTPLLLKQSSRRLRRGRQLSNLADQVSRSPENAEKGGQYIGAVCRAEELTEQPTT